MRSILPLFLCWAFLLSPPANALKVGEAVPDIAGFTLHTGQPLRLSELRGKVVYLDFWASWCGPCLISLPLIEQMRAELKDYGFEVLGVNLDLDANTALRMAQQASLAYPNLRGVDEALVKQFGIIKMPAGFLIDRDGVLRYAYHGFSEKGFAQIRPKVEALAKKKRNPP